MAWLPNHMISLKQLRWLLVPHKLPTIYEINQMKNTLKIMAMNINDLVDELPDLKSTEE